MTTVEHAKADWNTARAMCGCHRCVGTISLGIEMARACQVQDAFLALATERWRREQPPAARPRHTFPAEYAELQVPPPPPRRSAKARPTAAELLYTIEVSMDDEGDFVGRVIELPGCSMHGAEITEMLTKLGDTIEDFVDERQAAEIDAESERKPEPESA
jgi:predicted RNase H-like HicB family nuclease